MKAEIEHSGKLLNKEGKSKKRKVIFVSPDGDDLFRKLGIIKKAAAGVLGWAEGANAVEKTKVEDILRGELEDNPPASFRREDIRQKVIDILSKHKIELDVEVTRKLLSRETAAGLEEAMENTWKTIADSTGKPDTIKNIVDISWIGGDLTAEQFAQRIAVKVTGA